MQALYTTHLDSQTRRFRLLASIDAPHAFEQTDATMMEG